nr:MAG TPA: hypothetical protein [Caudoviricetes sp.]
MGSWQSGVILWLIGTITSAWVWTFRADQNRDRPCCRAWGHLR